MRRTAESGSGGGREVCQWAGARRGYGPGGICILGGSRHRPDISVQRKEYYKFYDELSTDLYMDRILHTDPHGSMCEKTVLALLESVDCS